ncbi:MAG: dephospho-CoA kinase [Candidatus Margulisbacteria bacterium]|nr:dephospho-CoA kinase [Candidatus Margulisiibacteriota bacterium]MBU1021377.1 dephospho-CoA kinase [Candidatus Margulisiibacteriota bacterium]MBU1729134.1 dephospho-CoA kinase [Candidatus Margulisiibacteriota bacterium]MBU1954807.1 dephospho-CoA kinase [Candidatus Margulisiibacteriota bacterium]
MTKIIGLTGPVGAGKSVVASMFKRRRAYVIDVDKLAHTLYKPQTEIWGNLVRRFGSDILVKGGRVSRRKLAKIVFADPATLVALNHMVHPALYDLVAEEVKQAKDRGEKIIVINAAVLKKIGLDKLVDEIWAVTAKEALRLKRLIKKGVDKSSAKKLMKSQGKVKEFLTGAKVILENNSTLASLKNKVIKITA